MPTSERLAYLILNGHDALMADFQNLTLTAKARFENAEWDAVHQAATQRLDVYNRKRNQIIDLIHVATRNELRDLELWRETKIHYNRLIQLHSNYEIAESFFNSIFFKIFDHTYMDEGHAFVTSSQTERPAIDDFTLYNSYQIDESLPALMDRIMEDYRFSIPWEDKTRDVAAIVSAMDRDILHGHPPTSENFQIDLLEPVFFRNKGAYLVGRVRFNKAIHPFLLPVLNNGKGAVFIDAVLSDPDEASIVFGFTRSYFMVDALVPSKLIAFLKELMPNKTIPELYTSTGLRKHAKTEFYRDFLAHLADSDDQFVIAPGIKGMVMSVFTLPSYDIVFKVIKDKFTPPKTVTHDIVREKYRLVTAHDKVGRMADTSEFTNFAFPLNRFSDELLKELQEVAPSQLMFRGDKVYIRHLYTERRMIPLNIYLADASDDEIYRVIGDYGQAIKELAAANIFAGDMLLKNFGVTRHGRVVFYDYDEICHLTECHFRDIPEPQNEEQAMSDQPWYSVAENDIFPEEFRHFFTGNERAHQAFELQHGDFCNPEYWRALQQDIKEGVQLDYFPYPQEKRFSRPS